MSSDGQVDLKGEGKGGDAAGGGDAEQSNARFTRTASGEENVELPALASASKRTHEHHQASINVPDEDHGDPAKLLKKQHSAQLARLASQKSIRVSLIGSVDLSWHHVRVELPANEKRHAQAKVILDDGK